MVTLPSTAQDWIASGHDPLILDSVFFRVAPWVFALAVAAVVLRAVAAQRRLRAVDVLTPADQERIRGAIRSIEDTTSAEIVPLVVERSDPQLHTLLLGAAAFAAVANLALLGFLPSRGFLPLGAAELALLALGLLLAWLCPEYRRWFLTSAQADGTAGEQAMIELARLTQGRDPTAPVVLLFVSLFEHRVIVLASSSAAGAVLPGHWPRVVEAVLSGVRVGRLGDGLVAGLEACAEPLRASFPPGTTRENHLADRAITRRE
jgi:putative membrane protein